MDFDLCLIGVVYFPVPIIIRATPGHPIHAQTILKPSLYPILIIAFTYRYFALPDQTCAPD